jgi:hypothetical protein
MKRILLFLLPLFLWSCQSAPPPTATVEKLLYSTDFSKPEGWVIYSDKNCSYQLKNGQYEIEYHVQNSYIHSKNWIDLPVPYAISVDVTLNIKDSYEYGYACILFNYAGPDDFDCLVINKDRYFSVWNLKGKTTSTWVPWSASGFINPPGKANTIKICQYEKMCYIYSNGNRIAKFLSIPSKNRVKMALGVGCNAVKDTTRITAQFDNLNLYELLEP